MKKQIFTLVLALALALVPMVTVFANEATVYVLDHGKPIFFPDQQPIIVGGRTLVPIAPVFQSLGFEIHWNPTTRQATLTRDANVIVVTVDSATFTTNNISHALDVPAQIIGGRTMVPIAPILRTVGLDVIWDGATRTVDIVPAGFITPVPPIATLPPVAGSSPVGTWVGILTHGFERVDGIFTFVFNADGTGYREFEGYYNEGAPQRTYFTWLTDGDFMWFGFYGDSPNLDSDGFQFFIDDVKGLELILASEVVRTPEGWLEFGGEVYFLAEPWEPDPYT